MSTPPTNLSSTGTPLVETPPVAGIARGIPLVNTLIMLVRRELWEHRALWLAPLLISVLLVACAFPIHIGPLDLNAHASDDVRRLALFGVVQWGLTVPQYIVMVIVLNFYLLDCLYAERKDRSILFWKSLPVSDATTVASKLLVAVVVVPLGVYLLAMITNLLFSAIWLARASFGMLPSNANVWDTVVWLKVEALMLVGLFVSMLWYAPLAAYLVMVSAWARRAVFLWAVLPPVFAVLVEHLAFGTRHVAELITYRTTGIWDRTNMEQAAESAVAAGQHQIVSLAAFFDALNIREFLLNIDVWLGLAVAVVFAFVAVRLRRYRDDT
jgi:ABC-2 type transport system permease protein